MSDRELIEVTQADREEAASVYRGLNLLAEEGLAADGHYDDDEIVQAFARHRQASTASLNARVEAVRHVIEYGLPREVKHGEICSHGRLNTEDCIGCYDEALLAALNGALLSESPSNV